MFSKESYLPEMAEIGSILQEKRKSLNLTVEKAAELSGLNTSDILAIENCENIYPIPFLILYCKSLGFTLTCLSA